VRLALLMRHRQVCEPRSTYGVAGMQRTVGNMDQRHDLSRFSRACTCAFNLHRWRSSAVYGRERFHVSAELELAMDLNPVLSICTASLQMRTL
jgi:hypothetical protein